MLPLFHVQFGDAACLAAHCGKEFGPFGNADSSSCVQDVKGLALAQHIVVGGRNEAALDAGLGLGVVEIA